MRLSPPPAKRNFQPNQARDEGLRQWAVILAVGVAVALVILGLVLVLRS